MMRHLRPFAAAALVAAVSVACATKVGYWPPASHTYSVDREKLKKDVSSSLEKNGWMLYPGASQSQLDAILPGPGGHRTIGNFRFVDVDRDSAFELTVGSHHVVNWLSCGILGLAMQSRARAASQAWLDEWEQTHK